MFIRFVQPLPSGYVWEMRLFTLSSVLVYMHYQKYIFKIFSLLYCKITEKVWDFSPRSRCPEDCSSTQIKINIIFVIQIKSTNSSSSFPLPVLQTQNRFKEESSFPPFNILSCLCLGFKYFWCLLLNWAEDYLMWQHRSLVLELPLLSRTATLYSCQHALDPFASYYSDTALSG